MKRFFILLLALSVCFCATACAADYQKYSNTYLGVFDTEITVIGYAQSQQAFDQAFAKYGPNATVLAMPFGGATLPMSNQ